MLHHPLLKCLAGLCLLLSLSQSVAAERVILASSLFTCMDHSLLSADHFNVAFTPENRTISYDVSVTSEVKGYVSADIEVYAYGIKIITETINPCDSSINIGSLCPLIAGAIDIQSSSQISASIIDSIPGVAFTVPNIDATVIVRIKDNNSTLLACIEADLTNTKTVEHVAVKWVTAVISGFGLVTSAVIATLGFSLSSAHVAANAVSLFSYFQSVVIITMCAVDRLPPIASAWAQNLAWSVGLIRVSFMQKIFRWYVQATGGTPTTYISYPTISILVQKRDQLMNTAQKLTNHTRDLLHALSKRLVARETIGYQSSPSSSDTLLVLRGIHRVAYQAGIESTSVVLTSFTFFVLICLAIALCFVLFYGLVALLQSTKSISPDRFVYFRANWRVMLKGTILRILFIACPSIFIFSMWEFISRDSAAVIVLAVFFLALSLGILGWSICKVYLIGRESTVKHQTPAYLLFSDIRVLNRYGFLYISHKASAYFFLIPVLGYIFVKSCFVAFAQSSGKTQALALFILELVYFISLCYYRPYMDKSTNAINIAISAVMLVNALFFLFFSELFNQIRAVASIMGVIFFILNAAFSLILLLFILITCAMALLSRNPDSRYKPAQDDRASFIRDQKHQPGDAAELTALGVAMRADHDEAYVPDNTLGPFDTPDENAADNRNRSRSSVNTYSSYENNPFSEKTNIDGSVVSREQAGNSSFSDTLDYPPNNRGSIQATNSIISSRSSTVQQPFEFSQAPSGAATPDGQLGHARSESRQSMLNSPVGSDSEKQQSKWKVFEKKE